MYRVFFFFFQAEDGIRDGRVTGVQTCALPIWRWWSWRPRAREQVREEDRPPRGSRVPLNVLERVWGEAVAFLDRSRRLRLVDLLVIAGVIGLIVAASRVAGEWRGAPRPEVTIDLSPHALPRYALFSLSRGLLAYLLSLGFSLVYGYWAAKDRTAERLLIPM